ncbi:hypothetical protein L1276_000942 [Flavobacterium sp. HSC-32F16]|nr:hypothetical protein [Flavobacterium sp. HSC-32F16]
MNLQFFGTEIWSPDWNHFDKTDDLNISYSWTKSLESIDKSVFRRNA